MRLDDLLLDEDQYMSSHGVSASEWVLMYSLGVPPMVIARWCRVGIWRVTRAIGQRTAQDPEWFGRCLMIHDQPALLPPSKRARVGRGQAWMARYVELRAYVRAHDRFPSQNAGERQRVMYDWLQAQRAHHRAGTLATEKVQALDTLGAWEGTPRGDPDTQWSRRLGEVRAFRTEYGRDPRYDPQRRPDEKVLAVWLGYQRTLARKNRLRDDRRDQLNQVLPGWDASLTT